GEESPLQIVCGAPNVRENILVPVALVGAELPGGFKIKKGKLRGVESFGMICSGPELDIPTYLYPSVGDEGILIFNEDYPVGTDVNKIFMLDDIIFDFDILANRPDLLSILGIARESAAVFDLKFNMPRINVNEIDEKIDNFVSVEVIDGDACPRYAARVIKNVKIAPSPLWLRAYLHKSGIRSINNIVDITNYIMLETGHPMHAFDLDKVKGKKITVRYAKEGEKLTTLDGKIHGLRTSDLMICDEGGATGLAGIMGGFESEIDENTKNVVFECACFDRSIVRKSSRALGIRTESSGRFEKGVSAASIPFAINRACQLVNMLEAGNVVSGMIDIYTELPKVKTVVCSVKNISKRTGVNIPAVDMINILNKLGFTTSLTSDTLSVNVPLFRLDVEIEADICEEVLRLYGYEHIPATPLRGSTTQGGISPLMAFKNKVASVIKAYGFMETMRYSFISRKSLEKLGLNNDDIRLQPLELMNPLGEDTAIMRTSLVPDMLQTISLNINHGNLSGRFFENAKIFLAEPKDDEGLPFETNSLCLGMYGEEDIDFYSLRQVIESLMFELGIDYTISKGADNYYHVGRSAKLVQGENTLATLGEITPDVSEAFEISKRVYIAELNIDLLQSLAKRTGAVNDLPKYPSVHRDLSIVFEEQTQIGDVMQSMQIAGGKLLENVFMFDVYRGAPVPPQHKSVAFSIVFRSSEKTLSDDDIQKHMNNILKTIEEKYNGKIRQ
ncbi:MAG: phenylalanine--tRNA ligase subunit beta, partial [Christensenellaceae bacterium]|nr:phenylalanine--tRNA ligase subunit beta [Christensenellaceae bacterium]